ncbi:MAG: ATP synthase F0 subunit C [Bdellovibrionales bacterium]|nr:ATP synthase F0 subunit C [Bdellovibrionales bacterium]
MKKAIFLAALFGAFSAFAQEAAVEAAVAAAPNAAAAAAAAKAANAAISAINTGWYALGASLAIGLAAFGGAFAQGRIGASAMDGIARNPQAQSNMFVSMIIGLVLIESLVIYSLVIAFMLVGKI